MIQINIIIGVAERVSCTVDDGDKIIESLKIRGSGDLRKSSINLKKNLLLKKDS